MRVVIAVHHFPPRYRAGAELRALDAAAWLRKNGHEVSVVCVERIDQGPETGLQWEDDVYEGIPVRRLSYDLSRADDRFRWEYDNPWIEGALGETLDEVRPDVFHLFSGYLMGAGALRAAKARALPVVVTLNDFWFLCPRINLQRPDGKLSAPDRFDPQACARCKFEEKRRFRSFARAFPGAADWLWGNAFRSPAGVTTAFAEMEDRFRQRNQVLVGMLEQVDALICPSRFVLEAFQSRGIAPAKLFLNTHGIDSTGWTPLSAGAPDPDRGLRIGYLGQVEPHKGVHLLLEAFSTLRSSVPLSLAIYGSPPASEQYQSTLDRLAGGDRRIRMHGRYEPQQLGQILSQIDVLAIPSTWNEIGPLVMYEALRARIPVVASDLPNMSYIIQPEVNGLLFRCGDSADLASKLQRCLEEPDLLPRLREGIEPVKSIDEEMREIERIYFSVLESRQPVLPS
jgi:glycosyltransferase involved in cell wall biosynthesis